VVPHQDVAEEAERELLPGDGQALEEVFAVLVAQEEIPRIAGEAARW
jgi:hypothetical protein